MLIENCLHQFTPGNQLMPQIRREERDVRMAVRTSVCVPPQGIVRPRVRHKCRQAPLPLTTGRWE